MSIQLNQFTHILNPSQNSDVNAPHHNQSAIIKKCGFLVSEILKILYLIYYYRTNKRTHTQYIETVIKISTHQSYAEQMRSKLWI